MPATAKREAFITLKDHKANFRNNPTSRLINPCKSEIGKISKQILDRINTSIRESTPLQQWRNTKDAITWFNQIENKRTHSFITFDICDFYPSITPNLLQIALEFAANYTTITSDQRHIIMHSKQTTLYYKKEPWCKKSSSFDVAMGSFDGAETCELVGLYLLSRLQKLDINVGLYRDDGLAVSSQTPKKIEETKKKICKIFQNYDLRITIEANKKIIDFLDVTFDLEKEIYKPYAKPNNIMQYVHKNSNHPPAILKNIPANIAKRLSQNSKTEEIFKTASAIYNNELKKNGYKQTITYERDRNETPRKRTRTRNIVWYNPPFNKNLQINLGKKFLNLIDKHFPKENKLSKIINRNTIKISYSCLPNVKQIIRTHNRKVLSDNRTKNQTQEKKECNCRKKVCPVEGQCLKENVIYQATVEEIETKTTETYIGLTQNSFKTRYNLHTSSFKLVHQRKNTALSEHIWKIRERNNTFKITWKILKQTKRLESGNDYCDLCTTEKLYILSNKHQSTLNIKTEMFNKCLHKRTFFTPSGRSSRNQNNSAAEPSPDESKMDVPLVSGSEK